LFYRVLLHGHPATGSPLSTSGYNFTTTAPFPNLSTPLGEHNFLVSMVPFELVGR